MRNVTENNLGENLANLIQSQSPIQGGSARQSRQQGQTVAVRLNQKIPGTPSTVRAVALNSVQPGTSNVNLIRLPKPVNGAEWGAFSVSSNQSRGSSSEVNVSQVPQPSGAKKEIKIMVKIGYTGKIINKD